MQELVACELRRAVNVGRARLGRSIVKSAGSCVWLFVCECGAAYCAAELEVSLDDFDAVCRSGEPLLQAGHAVTKARVLRAEARRLTGEAEALTAEADQIICHHRR
jgi:hypothetical protein